VGFLTSSIGRKYLMGISGLIMAGFVLVHMAGNLIIFLGEKAYNTYSHAIISNLPLLYGTEVVLLLAFITHVTMGLWLTAENRSARKKGYVRGTHGEKAATFASKSMAYHGMVLLFFIIWHLLTFKFGPHYTVVYDGVEMRDLFSLLTERFADPVYTFGYFFCMLMIGLHLSHGLASSFQSLGLNHPKYTPKIRKISVAYGIVIALGFISQPFYFYFVH
jgi:succinate dehydrogenase / fumarate reductase cytochrome b subunit